MSRSKVHIVVEGPTDEYVVKSILRSVGWECGYVRGLKGKAYLLSQLSKYNEAARSANWLVVLDLDQDAVCAPDFVRTILPNPAAGMLLRIPVRAIDAWILADRDHFARFLNISVENLPTNPDLEPNPKVSLINLAKKCRNALREDIVPRPESGRKEGIGYTGRMLEFIRHPLYPWRPEVAAENSDSLKRCLAALKSWQQIGYHDPD
ncbi:MAG TPA: hypothetical protein VHO69_01990 [Phototrophicaceae bacterium]|nr:hypothetical protein [Phototrophicaceae bacterium]